MSLKSCNLVKLWTVVSLGLDFIGGKGIRAFDMDKASEVLVLIAESTVGITIATVVALRLVRRIARLIRPGNKSLNI